MLVWTNRKFPTRDRRGYPVLSHTYLNQRMRPIETGVRAFQRGHVVGKHVRSKASKYACSLVHQLAVCTYLPPDIAGIPGTCLPAAFLIPTSHLVLAGIQQTPKSTLRRHRHFFFCRSGAVKRVLVLSRPRLYA